MRWLKGFGRDLYDDLGLERFKEPEKTALDPRADEIIQEAREQESLTKLKPPPRRVTPGEVADAKRLERERMLRAGQLARQEREAESIDTRPHECDGLFGDLALLAPADGVEAVIEAFELFAPSHPHWDKQMAAFLIRRGVDTYRLLCWIDDAHNPVVQDREAQKSPLFTAEERIAIAEGRPLKLDDWEAYQTDQGGNNE